MRGDMEQFERQLKQDMQSALDHYKQELKSLRTGRANTDILAKVQVEIYGNYTPLARVANVTVAESRQLVVTPFDVTNVQAIAKAIGAALNLNPMIDGKIIRVHSPPMDEAMRKQIAKQVKEEGEKAKVKLREIRRKKNELVRKEKADGKIPEDQMKRQEKTIQELTDRFCKDIDAESAKKEKEIMTV